MCGYVLWQIRTDLLPHIQTGVKAAYFSETSYIRLYGGNCQRKTTFNLTTARISSIQKFQKVVLCLRQERKQEGNRCYCWAKVRSNVKSLENPEQIYHICFCTHGFFCVYIMSRCQAVKVSTCKTYKNGECVCTSVYCSAGREGLSQSIVLNVQPKLFRKCSFHFQKSNLRRQVFLENIKFKKTIKKFLFHLLNIFCLFILFIY